MRNFLCLCFGIAACGFMAGQEATFTPKLLLAVASYRDRAKYPTITFYEHDGQGMGKIVGTIPSTNMRSDSRPSLSHDGKLCTFASETENQTSKILLWNLADKKLVELPKLNDSPSALLHPCLSGDGKLLAFAAWNRPGSSQRWDIVAYDVGKKEFAELSGVNTQSHDERMPSLCGAGRFLAFTSNASGGAGLSDIVLFDRVAQKPVALPGLNSATSDVTPSVSADGNRIAFASDRAGGTGGRDIYLYDRSAAKVLALPGLNSAAQEQSPALSPDGRYITFVSERISGAGERDVFLYDCEAQQLLSTPGLNCARDDIDPCIIVLK